ncbi:ABC-2 family transporter protein [soil metagenome]
MTVTDAPTDRDGGPPRWPVESRSRTMWSAYRTMGRTSVMTQFQYRTMNYFFLIGMVAEPLVYLVVWQTIARQQGGAVDGYTPGHFAAYYITWTLVRNMNVVFTPFGWEERIVTGELSGWLMRPLHPVHYDIGYFAGWKVVTIVLWLPIAGVLAAIFRPELQTSVLQVAVFAVAIWGAFMVRALMLWLLGMITLWTTRIAAICETYFMAELLLSGRLVPMALLPDWAQRISWFLPFRWAFAFPITALVGPIDRGDLVIGLAMQLLWIGIGAGLINVVWRRGMLRYGAVGG